MPQNPLPDAADTPDPSLTIVLTRWHVPDGDRVEAGQTICELASEHVGMSCAADRAGTLHHLKREGEAIHPGDEIARIDPEAPGAIAPEGRPE